MAIALLIAVHVAAGAVAAVLSSDQPDFSSGVFFALVTSQATLVGMWAGLGQTHGGLRLLALTAASLLLATELGLGLGDLDGLMCLFVGAAAGLVALTTWVVRLWKARLGRLGEAAPPREGLQFTIKHLMLLTFAVACLVTIGKALAPLIASADVAARVAALAVCFVAIALASLWAMLGLGHAPVRMVVVLPLALGAGAAGGAIIDGSADTAFWVFVSLTQAVFLGASLAIVRATGYRLIAR